MHLVEVVPWSIAATYSVIAELPFCCWVESGGEGQREERGDTAADERADDRHPGVAPLRAALALDRQDPRVGDARAEVAGGIDGITGGAAERVSDHQHDERDAGIAQRRVAEGGHTVHGRARARALQDPEHQHERADDLGHRVPELVRNVRDRGEDAQRVLRLVVLVELEFVGGPAQDRADDGAEHLAQ